MSNSLQIAYSTFSGFYGKTPVYYRSTNANNLSFELYATVSGIFVTCAINATADVNDFTTNHQSTSTSVASADDAQALAFNLSNPLQLNNGGVAVATGYVGNATAASSVVRATTGFTFYASGAQRSVASSSASDTSAGTGARTVLLTYYDANMTGPYQETITLNGTSAVNTVGTTIQFIESLQVLTVGSGGANVGTISIFSAAGGGGGSFACIAPGDNSTYWAHHFVAANASCRIQALDCAASKTAGGVQLFAVGDPRATNVTQVNMTGTKRYGTTSMQIVYGVPIIVAGPNFVFMSATPDLATTGNTIFGSFQFQDT